MDRVELGPVRGEELERVALMKLEGVARLWFQVDADDLKPGARIAHRGAASSAEEIEEPRLHGTVTQIGDDQATCQSSCVRRA